MVSIHIKAFQKLIFDYTRSNSKTHCYDMTDAEFFAHDVLENIHAEINSRLQSAEIWSESLSGNDEPDTYIAEVLIDTLKEIKEFIEIISTNGDLDNCCTSTINWDSEWEIIE